jgi:hypothetical protein
MADSTNTTVLVIAAAAVVVAVMWSRRASAASAGAGAAGRRPSGPAQPSGPDYAGILQGAGSFFSGLADLSDSFSSDEESVYTIPSNGASDQGLLGAESFIGQECSADYNCGFGERCAGGFCVPETAAVASSDEFFTV